MTANQFNYFNTFVIWYKTPFQNLQVDLPLLIFESCKKKYVTTGITKNNCEKLIKKLIILQEEDKKSLESKKKSCNVSEESLLNWFKSEGRKYFVKDSRRWRKH